MTSQILKEARDVMRRRQHSIRSEKSYCGWIKRYIHHFNIKSRADLYDGSTTGVKPNPVDPVILSKYFQSLEAVAAV